jgi:hypothetical protein
VLCLLYLLLLGLEVSLLTSRFYINNRTYTGTEVSVGTVGTPIYCAVPVGLLHLGMGHRKDTDTDTEL